jgi:hypothetical protein
MSNSLGKKPNPFSHNRVDTPFQTHTDFDEVYQDEFSRLQSIIEDIRDDEVNHQSKGAVVIGEPGMGKTHMMMRLARERLKNNRLLFIRQPNNLSSVLYHIYSRVLESFVEKVPGSDYSQLEHLLANSFSKIIRQMSEASHSSVGILASISNLTNKDKHILEVVSEEPLNMYQKLGREGSRRKREYWQRIENMVAAWWKNHYSESGYSMALIQGIIKYCSYSEPNKRKLVGKWLAANELEAEELENIGLKNWSENVSQEAFSLEAMSVFGKLSILDEPLIIIFDQLEALGEVYNEDLLLSFGEAVKEIFTHVPNSLIILNLFPQRWEHFQSVFDGAVLDRVSQEKIILTLPEHDKLKQILALNAQPLGIDIDELFTSDELADILTQKTIRNVLVRASDHYKHKVYRIYLPKRSNQKATSLEEVIAGQLKALEEKVTEKDFEPAALMEQLKALEEKITAKGLESEGLSEQLKGLEEKITAKGVEPVALTEQLKALEQKITAKGVESEGITAQLKALEEKITAKGLESEGLMAQQLKALEEKITAKGVESEGITAQLKALEDKITAKGLEPEGTTEQLNTLEEKITAKGLESESISAQLKALEDKITAKGLEPESLTAQLKALEEKITAKGLEPVALTEQLKALEEKITAKGLESEGITEQLKALEEKITAKGVEPVALTEQLLKALEEKLTARRFEEKLFEEFQVLRQEIAGLKTLMEEVAMALKSQTKPIAQVKSEQPLDLELELEEELDSEKQKEQASVIEEYLDEQKALLAYEYDNASVNVTDSDDIGKLTTILNAFETTKTVTISNPKLQGRKMRDYLHINTPTKSVIVSFLQNDGNMFTSKLKRCNELLFRYKDIQFFVLFRDQRQPSIDKKGGVGKEELQKFRNSKKGSAIIMDKDNRVSFELIYKLITDVLNKEEDFVLFDALNTLESYLSKDYWLIRLLK